MNLLKLAGYGYGPGKDIAQPLVGFNFGNNSSNYNWQQLVGDPKENAIVRAGILFKHRATSELRLTVEEYSGGKWVESVNPQAIKALSTILRPNSIYGHAAIMLALHLEWDTRGGCLLFKRRDVAGRMIGLYWLPYRTVIPYKRPEDTDLLVSYWTYSSSQGGTIDPKDTVYIRNGVDGDDTRRGFCPLGAAYRDIGAENEGATAGATLLRNGAVTTVITPKVNDGSGPDESVLQRAKAALNNFTRDKRGEMGMIPMSIDIQKVGMTPAEMNVSELRATPTSRICSALGIDPMVLGLPSESKTYNNYGEAIDAAGKQTILPTVADWAWQFGDSIFPEFGLDPNKFRFVFDTSDASWLKDETADDEARIRENFKVGAYDLYRYKELLREVPTPADKGVTYFQMLAQSRPALMQPDKQAKLSVSARQMLKLRSLRPYTKSTKPVMPNRYQAQHDRIVTDSSQKFHDLAAKYGMGQMTREEFMSAYDAALVKYHGEAYSIGMTAGGGAASKAQMDEVGRAMADVESQYLQGLADAIENGDYDDENGDFNPDAPGLINRTGLYGGKVSSSATSGFVDASPDSMTFDWQLGGDEDHCPDCPELAAAGSFTKSELITTPRAGDTQCLGNCQCSLVRSDGQKGFGPL